MRKALSERPVKGTSACVCAVDETKKSLEVNKTDGFSKLHNIQFEQRGIRVWRSYGISRGKEIPFDQLVSQSQESTGLLIASNFFALKDARVYKCKEPLAESSDDDPDSELDIFECSEPGCVKSFQTFSELESHLGIRDHAIRKDTLYDQLHREWVDRFTLAVKITDTPCTSNIRQNESDSPASDQAVGMGWALAKPRPGSSRFSDKVKRYLTAKFDLGEQTGHKADPQQVSNDMRKITRQGLCNFALGANVFPFVLGLW